jgi:hypothetical protein
MSAKQLMFVEPDDLMARPVPASKIRADKGGRSTVPVLSKRVVLTGHVIQYAHSTRHLNPSSKAIVSISTIPNIQVSPNHDRAR